MDDWCGAWCEYREGRLLVVREGWRDVGSNASRRSLCMMQDMCLVCVDRGAPHSSSPPSRFHRALYLCVRALCVSVVGSFSLFLMTNHFLYTSGPVYSSYSVPTTQVRSLRDLCDHLLNHRAPARAARHR